MRSAVITSLILLGLLLLCVRTESSAVSVGPPFKGEHAKKGKGAPPREPVRDEPMWKMTVVGPFAKSYHDAWEQARQEATKALIEKFLHQQQASWLWLPTPEYLDEAALIAGQHEEQRSFEPPIETMRRVVLELEVTPRAYADMRHRDQEARVQQRMTLLAKVLIALVVLLTCVAGYFRLDEYTKGYYTFWLRAGVVTLVVGGVMLLAWVG
ncbi:MAG: hypothetical protein ACK4RK_07835 [Gemmataceae bacterium]